MRAELSADPGAHVFDEFTLQLGNGEMETVEETDQVHIPQEMCLPILQNSVQNPHAQQDSMVELAKIVYPKLRNNFSAVG